MGKKKLRKHQKEPNDSSHSSDEVNENTVTVGSHCPHIKKSVYLNGVKKVLKQGFAFGRCETCSDNKDTENSTENSVTWLCLKCGYQGCGRYTDARHAYLHYKTPRSDEHSLVTNTDTWEIWCYQCDNEINLDSSKILSDCVNFIRRFAGAHPVQSKVLVNGISPKNQTQCKKENQKEISKKAVQSVLPVVKGLRNLGNTCFFNAIMQNLTRCHSLTKIFDEYCAKGATIKLSADFCRNENEPNQNLKPIDITLTECGQLTQSLLDFFHQMSSTTSGKIINPGSVLTNICKKAPQFRGTKQQDSHELLRHLMDGIRNEEIRRQKAAILKVFNFHEKIDPKTVDEDVRQKLKAYGRLANHTIIDWIFCGQLISTVQCKECNNASQIFESFLDLSLPVSEEKPLRPGVQRRMSGGDIHIESNLAKNDKPSRYQEKKAKRMAKKDTRRGKGRREKSITNTMDSLPEIIPETNNSSSNISESDADEEDNAESEKPTIDIIPPDVTSPIDAICTNVQNVNLDASDLNGVDVDTDVDVDECKNKHLDRDHVAMEWVERSLTTLASRYQPASHECSILSCLNQFTAPELLTGNNKFGCEHCTKAKREKSPAKTGKKSDIVYTNASKQLLIFSPPAVLTLHLKRFQQVGQILKKVNRHVEFPLILDLAPFCSSMSEVLPNITNHQSQILYSLFGVVEHSGRLASGHYTAYVNVKPNDQNYTQFLNLNASTQYSVSQFVDDMITNGNKPPLNDNPSEIKEKNVRNSGKWFYVSDSSVSEVSESNVLQSQAYILFYERIF